MAKKGVFVTLDENAVNEAKSRKINLSGTLNTLLMQYLQISKKESKIDELEKERNEISKASNLMNVRENFLRNNKGTTEKDFIEFMDAASDNLKIRCGWNIQVNKGPEIERELN